MRDSFPGTCVLGAVREDSCLDSEELSDGRRTDNFRGRLEG